MFSLFRVRMKNRKEELPQRLLYCLLLLFFLNLWDLFFWDEFSFTINLVFGAVDVFYYKTKGIHTAHFICSELV